MSWTHTRSQIAIKKRANPDADVTELKRQLKAEKTQEYIDKVLAEAPPLSDEQRTYLAELLRPVRVTADRKTVVESRTAEVEGGAA